MADQLGAPPVLLAYPNGDYGPQVVQAAREAGYVGAFTCIPGRNRSLTRPLEIRRYHVGEASSAGPDGSFSEYYFEAELSGMRQGLVRMLKPFRRF